jgi:protein-L-isoaspartate O-methyltransferase
MPVGSTSRVQRLLRVVRAGEATYEREDLGDVAFLPLIGAEGWPHMASAEVMELERRRR